MKINSWVLIMAMTVLILLVIIYEEATSNKKEGYESIFWKADQQPYPTPNMCGCKLSWNPLTNRYPPDTYRDGTVAYKRFDRCRDGCSIDPRLCMPRQIDLYRKYPNMPYSCCDLAPAYSIRKGCYPKYA